MYDVPWNQNSYLYLNEDFLLLEKQFPNIFTKEWMSV